MFPCFSWWFSFLFVLIPLSGIAALLLFICSLLVPCARLCAARNDKTAEKAVLVRRLRHGLEFFDVIDFFFLLTDFTLAQLFGSWFVIVG